MHPEALSKVKKIGGEEREARDKDEACCTLLDVSELVAEGGQILISLSTEVERKSHHCSTCSLAKMSPKLSSSCTLAMGVEPGSGDAG
ncbi:hypothetical protein AOLI_G00306450 [Acnodon oligacanthus]